MSPYTESDQGFITHLKWLNENLVNRVLLGKVITEVIRTKVFKEHIGRVCDNFTINSMNTRAKDLMLHAVSCGYAEWCILEELDFSVLTNTNYGSMRNTMTYYDSTSTKRTENSNTMRHSYRVLTESEKQSMTEVKDMGEALLQKILSLGESTELSTASIRLQEAVMWAVKHITK